MGSVIDNIIRGLYIGGVGPWDAWDDNSSLSNKNISLLYLTQDCNWSCCYCDCGTRIGNNTIASVNDLDHLRNSGLTLYDIIDRLVVLTKGNDIILSGGEFALLDVNMIDYIFKSFKDRAVSVATNGLFFTKGYHKKYAGQFDKIYYHCVEELGQTIKYPNMKDIIYILLIHHKNISKLKDMFDMYPDIKFQLECYADDIPNDPLTLTKADHLKIRIYDKYL